MAAESNAVDYNTGYLRTEAGALRVGEVIIAIAAIISETEGSVCIFDLGRYNYFLFVVVVSMLEGILVLILIILRLEERVTIINIPLSLLLNDSIMLLMYFIASMLMMLSIGTCQYKIEARIISTLLGITGFLFLVGLSYTDYLWWKGEKTPSSKNSNIGITIEDLPPATTTNTL